MIFDLGDIVELDFNPTRRHESSNSMTIACPITSRLAPLPLHRELPEDCCVHGSVVMEQLRAVDPEARNAKRIGSLAGKDPESILICIRSFFDISGPQRLLFGRFAGSGEPITYLPLHEDAPPKVSPIACRHPRPPMRS